MVLTFQSVKEKPGLQFRKSNETIEQYFLLGGKRGFYTSRFPYPLIPGFAPFVGSGPFCAFRLRNIAQCCVIFHISPTPRQFENPAFRPLFSRLPFTSRPLLSRASALLSPSTSLQFCLLVHYAIQSGSSSSSDFFLEPKVKSDQLSELNCRRAFLESPKTFRADSGVDDSAVSCKQRNF